MNLDLDKAMLNFSSTSESSLGVGEFCRNTVDALGIVRNIEALWLYKIILMLDEFPISSCNCQAIWIQRGQLPVSVIRASHRLGNPVVSVSNMRYIAAANGIGFRDTKIAFVFGSGKFSCQQPASLLVNSLRNRVSPNESSVFLTCFTKL
jgi:hypothetical protein